jgi:hypothetical protein
MDRNLIGRYLLILLAAVFPTALVAQVSVTPTVAPTPPGTLIVVNNNSGGGNAPFPHVSGDLVCYTDSTNGVYTVHYFNLVTGLDAAIPPGPALTHDFLCDVRGSTIAFTRNAATDSQIYTFDVSAGGQPAIVSFLAGTQRQEPAIGDQSVIWQDFAPSFATSKIVAYNRATGITQDLSSGAFLDSNAAINAEGTVAVWQSEVTPAIFNTWKAILANGTWTAQQLVSQVQGQQGFPDTDGTTIVYTSSFLGANGIPTEALLWQPVGGGEEQILNLPGFPIIPTISGGLISFTNETSDRTRSDVLLYDVARNVLYNLTADLAAAGLYPSGLASQISDISVTPDGKVRVVWQVGLTSVYAYTFNRPVGDFNLGPISPMVISAGGSGSTSLTVNPLNGFSSAVSLSATGQPAGVSVSLTPNSVTPSGGTAASSVLNVNLPPFQVPTNFTLTVTGTSGTLTHSTGAEVTVTATTSSIGNLVGDLLGAGCIDNGGIANALTSKLSAAQAAISAGNVQTAINTLTALKNQINAQAGKHIATSCTIGGVTFNPVIVLLADVQGLIDSLRVSGIADPITGYVVDSNGAGVFGATVSILDAGGNPVATAATDITGYYFFATTGVLVPGSTYTVAATSLPAGFANAAPAASPAFMWSGTGMMIGNFALN